jgi:hypothetical protein
MSSPEDRLTATRQALIEILQHRGPQLGARLKVFLLAELGRRLQLTPPELHALVPKLSAFLAANSDLVQVSRGTGTGDILVSLRDANSPAAEREAEPVSIWYRPDVWHSFVNPDVRRHRFFHRTTHEIVHYLDNSTVSPNPEIARRVVGDRSFIEIAFASADLQTAWMREFLDTNALLPEWNRKIGRHFLSMPFESALNQAFAAALGQYSDAWKRFRATKADEYIRTWATTNSIAIAELQKPVEPTAAARVDGQEQPAATESVASTPAPEGSDGDLRLALHRLIDSMDERELRQFQIPASALLRPIRAKA